MGSQQKRIWEPIINSECWSKIHHSHPLRSPGLHLAKTTGRARCSATLAAAVAAQCFRKSDPRISYQVPSKGGHNYWLLVKTSSTLYRTAQCLCWRNRSGGANRPTENKKPVSNSHVCERKHRVWYRKSGRRE